MPKLQKTTQLWVLVVVVLLDLLAVSLVVPLLPARYRELGVGAKALGFASSAYSLAQIVGGLALGALSDRSLGHRGLLLLSFVGAATAYAIVGWPGATFYTLVGSRIVVGLCKQTMTASTALVAELTEPGPERATWVGRIASASQASWLVGQSVGAYLNRFGDPRVPSACAVGLYVICFVVSSATLPTGHAKQKKTMKRQNTSVLVASRAVAATAGARLAVAFAMRAAMVTRQVYELERWDLSRSDYASFGLFKSITGIAASWGLAGPLSRRFCQGCGTEHLVKGAAAVAVIAALAEAAPWPRLSTGVEGLAAKAIADPSLLVYACVIFPLKTAAGQVATIALRARFTEVVPASDTAGALAALDVASSAIGVAAPIVGGFAFDGVPVPRQPLVAATFYGAALFAILALFAFEKRPAGTKKED
jgi:predicted MFS family arabinose efflux permease